ncbi:oxysterol-binding protein-related protein 7 isoform X3 [Gopherus flavomarginatus]|uniref:oxysterol-binding protein-related protein 7 isoform X3 n=1 Tax=Gopherus flavomarginatus TaxID=286002 RepID=UPI0021CC3C7B|nr:oxysterol-binding protein-related protein 7 isoform X3 [Gopherus flavomarginatus]
MGSHEKELASPRRAPAPSRSNSSVSSKHSSAHQGSECWEVVDEPRGRIGPSQELERHEGYLLKKRKWPLKGWHKRYFVLEEGILKYATTRQDVLKGKLHGSVDVRLAVMSINRKAQRVDLDTEENIYHLKIKSQELFTSWVTKLCSHRLMEKPKCPAPTGGPAGRVLPSAQGYGSRNRVLPSDGTPALSTLTSPRDKVNAWLKDSEGLDRCSAELSECQGKLQELNKMLQSLETLHRIPSAPLISNSQTSAAAERPRKGKRTTRIWCTQSFAKDDTIGRVGRLHGSVPNLSRYLESSQSQPAFSLPPEYSQLQRSFWILAQKVHESLSSVVAVLTAERNRLQETRRALDLQRRAGGSRNAATAGAPSHNPDHVEYLRRFHSLSISSDAMLNSFTLLHPDEPDAHLAKGREQQLSNRSIVSLSDSHTEFFDACEVFLSASSSENEASDDESCMSEATNSLSDEAGGDRGFQRGRGVADGGSAPCASEPGGGVLPAPLPLPLPVLLPTRLPHRSCLPAPSIPAGDVSLWNILRNNVGKDLSKVSMPVQLNEPLNTLQRLCEELEYSTLLDAANRCADPCERLVCVAAFAVSAYASTYYRAGSKPFNPVLGETYECVRPDKGFRFISEQVCHHPPIFACHAESDNFIFWQDMKWKNKFWGKSLEIVPVGTVNVKLPRFGDHFEWNKVTSCIHNILSGQRWIEHYGEVLIRNVRDSSYHCKITFCKQARYWSSSVNEVQGAVLSRGGQVIHRLFGKWHEGLYRGAPPAGQCLWKPNPMPRELEKNYGFTQFALELNELTPELKRFLPSTDTRLRPDQRYLEEGNVQAAESQKRRIEQLQRDRRRVMEDNNIFHQAPDGPWRQGVLGQQRHLLEAAGRARLCQPRQPRAVVAAGIPGAALPSRHVGTSGQGLGAPQRWTYARRAGHWIPAAPSGVCWDVRPGAAAVPPSEQGVKGVLALPGSTLLPSHAHRCCLLAGQPAPAGTSGTAGGANPMHVFLPSPHRGHHDLGGREWEEAFIFQILCINLNKTVQTGA